MENMENNSNRKPYKNINNGVYKTLELELRSED